MSLLGGKKIREVSPKVDNPLFQNKRILPMCLIFVLIFIVTAIIVEVLTIYLGSAL